MPAASAANDSYNEIVRLCESMVSVIEKPEKVENLVRVVAEMMQDGIVVTSDVKLHQIVHEIAPRGGLK